MEVLGVDLVHVRKFLQIGHMDRRGHGIVEGGASLLENSLDVLERLPRLGHDSARDNLAGLRIDALFTGHKDKIANLDPLRVRSDRQGSFGTGQDFLLHKSSLLWSTWGAAGARTWRS